MKGFKPMINKERISVRILAYIFSLLLIIWYFSVLINSAKPNVSNEYKMHYIEKNLSDWPGDNGLDYHFGTKLMFGSNYKANLAKCRGNGWYRADEEGAWTKNKADLYFNLIDEIKGDGTLNLVLKKAVSNANVIVQVNGKEIASLKPAEGKGEYSVSIPEEVLKEKFLCISLNVDNVKSFRDLGINIKKDLRKFYNPKDNVGIYVESINLVQESN